MSIAIIYLIINIKFKLFFKIKAWLIPCFGGGGRIRTIEANRNRFTVCPLWPLGNSPIWSFMSESNQQPADYKSAALPLSQWSIFGGNNRDRTCDPLLVRQMLSQLSYASISIKLNFKWWGRTDSNHRSESQQIYSLPPLATRELPHLELHVGVEPTTCWLQVSCSAIEPMKHIPI